MHLFDLDKSVSQKTSRSDGSNKVCESAVEDKEGANALLKDIDAFQLEIALVAAKYSTSKLDGPLGQRPKASHGPDDRLGGVRPKTRRGPNERPVFHRPDTGLLENDNRRKNQTDTIKGILY